ncbi:MAG: DUF3006 domain-containing protein [Dehalococcoidales bacterium]|jgi:hypothetical protein|nr:DUF3006 domain-containing protein [Dehalococcoidales bacterium]
MIEKAVIDRIEDGKTAVMLVGEKEIQYEYSADKLPEGANEGSWVKLTIEDGEITGIELDEHETAVMKNRIQSKMDMLRKRGRN